MKMSTNMRVLGLTATLSMALTTPFSQAEEKAAPVAEATVENKNVPESLIREIQSYMRPTKKYTDRAKLYADMDLRFATVLKMGAKAVLENPGAPNLHEVREVMLYAAMYREIIKPDQADRKALTLSIAQQILLAPATTPASGDAALRVRADALLTQAKLASLKGKPAQVAKESEKLIRGLYDRHKAGPAAAEATIAAGQFAHVAKLKKLTEELADLIDAKYASHPNAAAFLMSIGRGPKFVAVLPNVDGTKVTMPDDMLGKVVVVDFWAMWCPPCLRAIPHMKEVYAKYKGKGVEFVGISLDYAGDKQKLIAFVKDKGLNWIHTFTGMDWNDPTVKKYGVEGIPSIWVIGKDGRVVSSNAHGNLEATLDRALAAPMKTPATMPAK